MRERGERILRVLECVHPVAHARERALRQKHQRFLVVDEQRS